MLDEVQHQMLFNAVFGWISMLPFNEALYFIVSTIHLSSCVISPPSRPKQTPAKLPHRLNILSYSQPSTLTRTPFHPAKVLKIPTPLGKKFIVNGQQRNLNAWELSSSELRGSRLQRKRGEFCARLVKLSITLSSISIIP